MGITMAEAARQLGVSVTQIRRFEREYNLNFQRNELGRCELSEQDVANLATIVEQRAEGTPVEEIRAMLQRTFVVAAETIQEGPNLKEVISALVSRQDELERVIRQQGQVISRLVEDNQRLLQTQDQLTLQLAAPAEAPELSERLDELEARTEAAEKALTEAAKDEVIRKLQRRLLDLEAAVATELSQAASDDENLLEELARTITQQAQAQRRRPWWQFWRPAHE